MNGASIPKDIAQPVGLPTIAGGLVRPLGGPRDLQDHQVYSIQNLIPYQGVLRTRDGRSLLGTRLATDEAILGLDNFAWQYPVGSNQPLPTAIGTKCLYVYEDTAWRKLQTVTANAVPEDTHVTTASIKNKNAQDCYAISYQMARPVTYFNGEEVGGSGFIFLGGVPLRAQIVRTLNDHLILFNVMDDSGVCIDRIRWGDYEDPFDFNEQHGTAGMWDIGSPDTYVKGRGGIIAAEPLRLPSGETVMIIYQEWGVHVMRWVGLPAVFSLQTIITDEGAASPRAVVPILTKEGEAHLVFGQRGIYIHRGSAAYDDVSQSSVFAYLVEYGATGTNRYRIFGYDRPQDFRVDFHLPLSMDPTLTWDTSAGAKWDTPPTSLLTWDPTRANVIFSYNYKEGTWTYLSVSHDDVLCAAPKTVRKHSFMAGVESDVVMYGTSDGYVLEDEADTGVDALASYNFNCRVDTKQFVSFDETVSCSRKGRIERVGIEARGSGQMTIYMKYDEADWVLCRTVTLTAAYDIWWIYPETSCEYYQISIRCAEWEDDDEVMQPSYMWVKQILRDVIPGTGR